MNPLLKNRTQAGRQLAILLQSYKNAKDSIVLALPRGGVPIAYEIALKLNLPLDVFVVRKVGLPDNKEYAIGAIAGENICLLNPSFAHLELPAIQEVICQEKQELARRNKLYRQNKVMPNLQGKRILLVDDGVATGFSIKAAILALQQLKPKEIIVVTPVIPPDTVEDLKNLTTNIVFLFAPEPFYGVGRWYVDFPQVSDDEVINLLTKANARCLGDNHG